MSLLPLYLLCCGLVALSSGLPGRSGAPNLHKGGPGTPLRPPKIIPIIARVKNRSFNVSCALAGEACDIVGKQLGVPGTDLAAVTEGDGEVLLPSDSIADKGLRAGSVLRIMRRRSKGTGAKAKEMSSKDELSGGDAIRKSLGSLSKGQDPASLQEALKGVEDMLKQGGDGLGELDAMMDAMFQEDSLELMRKQVIANADMYDKLLPGMKDHIASLASDPVRWKTVMMEARKQLGRVSDSASATEGNSASGAGQRADTAPVPTGGDKRPSVPRRGKSQNKTSVTGQKQSNE